MRQLFQQQLTLTSTIPSELIGKCKTRDDIDKLALGLNEIFKNKNLRNMIVNKIKDSMRLSSKIGREGMDYWKIFIFGVVRVALNIDYDRLQNLMNNHIGLRRLIGHGDLDNHKQYSLTSVKENIAILTSDLLDEINTQIVQHGRNIIHPYSTNTTISCRADSYVSKTNVHFPTDVSLLNDAMQKVIEMIGHACKANDIKGFRQYKHNRHKLKKMMRHVGNIKKGKSNNVAAVKNIHQSYIDFATELLRKSQDQLSRLSAEGISVLQQEEIIYYRSCAIKLIDQIKRRVINEEVIPHNEKIFSIFEPHTEWVSKGKNGVPVELGLKITIVQDQHQFILHHHVMEKEQDVDVAVKVTEAVREKYGDIDSISFDRGYWSPENENALATIVRKVVMPKKGYRSHERREIEDEKEFKKLKNKHSAVESGINCLQVHGLEKVPDHGTNAYKRYVALGVVGYNVHHIGSIILKKHYAVERKKAA